MSPKHNHDETHQDEPVPQVVSDMAEHVEPSPPTLSFWLALVGLDDNEATFAALTAAEPAQRVATFIPTNHWQAIGRPGTIEIAVRAV